MNPDTHLSFYFEKTHSEFFDKVLVFVSTFVGSVTGYYFGGELKPVPAGTASHAQRSTVFIGPQEGYRFWTDDRPYQQHRMGNREVGFWRDQ